MDMNSRKSDYHKVPRLAEWCLRQLTLDDNAPMLAGDIAEEYQDIVHERGRLYARLWYWIHVLISVPPFISNSVYWSIAMLSNYFKIAARNILKHRGYAFINIFGLAVGLACCMLIMAWIYSEVSIDSYQENIDNIYRLTYAETIGGDYSYYAVAPDAAAPEMLKELPEIESFVRIKRARGIFQVNDIKTEAQRGIYADSTFFDIFSHNFLLGDKEEALDKPSSIVLTTDWAGKLFGNTDPVGKTVEFGRDSILTVTAVIENVPKNSHMPFNFVISMSTYKKRRPEFEQWLMISGWTYLLLKDGADPKSVDDKMPALVDRNIGEILRKNNLQVEYFLQPMSDIYLKSKLFAEYGPRGDINHVVIFSAVAFFILLLACINFMNLSTARSARRSREVGMRKVFGARRNRLAFQFVSESSVMSMISFVLALILVQLVLPVFNSVTGKEMIPGDFLNPAFVISAVLLVLVTGILAGSYPAFFLSSFKPAVVLRGSVRTGSGGSRFRTGLVVFQFAVSIALIASTALILTQLSHMSKSDLGFDKEQTMVLILPGREFEPNAKEFKAEVLQHSSIKNASYSDGFPGRVHTVLTVRQSRTDLGQTHNCDVIFADHDFLDTYGIELKAGRDFSEDFSTDTLRTFIINEAAEKKLGWGEETVGKEIGFSLKMMRPIVGVVKDFNYRSLKDEVSMMAISLSDEDFNYLSLRIDRSDLSGTLAFLEKTWKKFEPDRAFEYRFVDEQFDRLYRSEQRLSTLISYLAAIAIFIACLGLLGLASFTAEQRTKEIGIRKVMGASAVQMVLLLSKGFAGRVLISNLIAWPVVYFFMQGWLENYAHRISFPWYVLAVSGLSALAVALLSVSFQAYRAARSNPADALRYE